MVVHRYLGREIAVTLSAVFVLLMLILLSTTFVRILADAAEGDYPGAAVFTLFGLKVLTNIPQVLSLALFLGVMLAMGRLYKDSEMAAMAACGIGPGRALNVALRIGVAVALVVAAMTLYVSPWAEDRYQAVLDEATSRAEVESLVAGRFHQASEGEHLLYVEDVSVDRKALENVFVHSRQPEGPMLVTARRGHQETDPDSGARFLVLEDGHRYDGRPGAADYEMVHFETYRFRLRQPDVSPSHRRDKATPTLTLWQRGRPGDYAEIQRRLSVILGTLLMALVAVPLSRTNPREGRYGRVFWGILIYLIYNNLLTVAQAWITKGRIQPEVGVWWVHLLVGLLLAALLFRQAGGLKGLRGAQGAA